MKNSLALTALISATILLSACTSPQSNDVDLSSPDTSQQPSSTPTNQESQRNIMPIETQKTMAEFEVVQASSVTLKTNKGDVVIELFTEEAPLTTTNFLNLVKSGFYDGIVFHRVEPEFVVQFGDPQTKDPGTEDLWGTGGPGYTIADEFSPNLRHDSAGILSMANRGPDTGGSQLFITLDATPFLDDKHAVLGKVSAGMDVVNQLEKGDKILSATYQ
jgi:peptidyl-prolyl cis-trans isomerase A (cyclophilin A)